MAEQKYFDFEICGLKRRLPFVKIADDLALARSVFRIRSWSHAWHRNS